LIVLLFFAVISARLFSLQVLHHDEYSRFARDNRLQRERVAAPRGFIKDRTGRILVDNVLHFEIVTSWRSREEVAQTAQRLASWVPIDTARVMAHFDAWKRRHGQRPFPIIPDADKFMISFVRENTDVFPKLRVHSRSRRRYRDGKTASHVLGYVGEASDNDVVRAGAKPYFPGDMVGKSALEVFYEDELRGIDGQRVLEVNASGRVLSEVKELSSPPTAGQTLHLTIDAALQSHLEGLLENKGASAAVVLDVEDGSILAAASSPGYDPNEFATGVSQAYLNAIFDPKTKPMFSRFLQARYPPASTFKIVSTYAVLTNHLVNPNEILVYCTGAMRFGNRIYHCWEHSGHGAMNLMTAFVQSCDVYFYKIAEIMDVDVLAAAARELGLGEKTGMDLPGEVRGHIPDREYYDGKFGKGRWTQGYVLNNIIGQGEYLANVVHIARMCAAVANGGYLVTPHIVHRVDGQSAVAYSRQRVPRLSGNTLAFIRRAMERVVSDPNGTAHWTQLDWLPTAGKTGTAENPHGEAHAWYTSYAPADVPRIAIAIIVENAGHGGEIAAPIARDVFVEYFGTQVSETPLSLNRDGGSP